MTRTWKESVDLFGSPMARAVRLDKTLSLIDIWFRLVELRGQRPSAEMHLLMTLIREDKLSLYEKAPGKDENLFIPIGVNPTELEIVFATIIYRGMGRDGHHAQELGSVFIDNRQAKDIDSLACALDTEIELSNHSATCEPQQPKKKTQRRGKITQGQAADLCGVSLRTFQNWEAGKKQPEGFRDRSDALAFRAWAESYKGQVALRRYAVQVNRARATDPAVLERFEDDEDASVWGK